MKRRQVDNLLLEGVDRFGAVHRWPRWARLTFLFGFPITLPLYLLTYGAIVLGTVAALIVLGTIISVVEIWRGEKL